MSKVQQGLPSLRVFLSEKKVTSSFFGGEGARGMRITLKNERESNKT
jgi:hypothetical protein